VSFCINSCQMSLLVTRMPRPHVEEPGSRSDGVSNVAAGWEHSLHLTEYLGTQYLSVTDCIQK
jgi:hypothetical protein